MFLKGFFFFASWIFGIQKPISMNLRIEPIINIKNIGSIQVVFRFFISIAEIIPPIREPIPVNRLK